MMINYVDDNRAKIMRSITSNNTRPEVIVRKFLYSKGLRYRKNVSSLPGKPDIYISKYNTVIFVNGCFWHVHDCGEFKMPSVNREYWQKKFNNNILREEKNIDILNSMGIKVIVLWECGLKDNIRQETLDELYEMIITEDEEMRLRELWLRCDYWEEFNEE